MVVVLVVVVMGWAPLLLLVSPPGTKMMTAVREIV